MNCKQAVEVVERLMESAAILPDEAEALETLIVLAQQFEELDGKPCVVCGGDSNAS